MSKSKKPLKAPAYVIPLKDDELILIGRINAMWAQIDFHLSLVLSHLHRIDLNQLAMFAGDKMLASRADMLLASLERARSPQHQDAIKEARAALKQVIANRNMVAHGCWGFNTDSPPRNRIGAFSLAKPDRDFQPSGLPKLHDQIAGLTHQMVDLWHIVRGVQRHDPEQELQFMFGLTVPGPAEESPKR